MQNNIPKIMNIELITDDDLELLSAIQMILNREDKELVTVTEIYKLKTKSETASPNKKEREALKKQLIRLSKTYLKTNDKCTLGGEEISEYGGRALDLHYITENGETVFDIRGVSPLLTHLYTNKTFKKVMKEWEENMIFTKREDL